MTFTKAHSEISKLEEQLTSGKINQATFDKKIAKFRRAIEDKLLEELKRNRS